MKRVVVVEDSPTQATHLRVLLERRGYSVVTALDGDSGLDACRRSPPDAVLCDVVMPGMDGYAFTRAFKADLSLRAIPVVLVTSLDDPRDVIRGVEAGADNYVTKPYVEARLVARLERILARRTETVPDARVPSSLGSSRLVDLFVSCLEDAVERNRELQLKKEELDRTNAQREELMRIVAHELRVPLQSLSLRAALMREAPQNAEVVASLPAAIDAQVGAMVRIIDDLSDLTALDLGTLHLEVAPVRVDTVVEQAVDDMQLKHPERAITLREASPLHVRADASRIQQVVANLLSNAVKYSGPSAPVAVVVCRRNGHARVEVRDVGPGIPADKQGRIFERYFRISPDSQAKGVGLGLYICRRIVEMHHGEIGVDSHDGEGSNFWFTIPVSSDG